MGIPNDLVRAVRQRRVVPIVGALHGGAEAGALPPWSFLSAPLAAELVEQGLRERAREVRRLAAAGDPLQAAELACRELGPTLFHRVLRARIRGRRPAAAALETAAAVWALEPPIVITTGFDDVLRSACPRDVEVLADDQDEELALLHEASSASPRLWHLYGTIHRLGTIVLGGADLRRLYPGSPRVAAYEAALFRLREAFADRPFLYVGFDLGDPFVLQTIRDLLAITEARGAPGFAIVRRGGVDAAALRASYNLHLVEHDGDGGPAELIREVARQAFHPVDVLPTAPDPAPPAHVRVPRPALEDEIAGELRARGRLVLLAPRRGGARTLAKSLAARHFGHRVTWLAPPEVPASDAARYFGALSGEPTVDDLARIESWLRARARAMGGEHLVVLRHDGGPPDHLAALGETLGAISDDARGAERVLVLVAGGAPSARLLHDAASPSFFAGAPARHVPPLGEAEVRAALDAAGLPGASLAADVLRATGGHPGLLEEAVLGRAALDFDALTLRLSRSPAVRGAIVARLSDDDRDARPEKHHARWVLRELLAGHPVRPLGEAHHQLSFPEARLYYDGLVIAAEDGATVLRCEAVRRAAALALEGAWERPEPKSRGPASPGEPGQD